MKKFCLILIVSFVSIISYAQNNVKGNKEVYLGNKAYEKGDLKTAISQYQQALKVAPNNLSALVNLGIAQSKMKNADASVKSFDNALNQSNNAQLNSTLNYDKGTTLATSKKYEDAIKSFENSLRINPDNQEARENLQKAINELKQQQNQQNKQNQNPKNQQQQKQDNKQQQNKQDQQKQQQQNQNQMSKEQAEQLLKALRNDEKETQKKLNEQKASGGIPQNGKDW